MISFKSKGNWNKTEKFLNKAEKNAFFDRLERYGEEGVRALSSATPKDTGKTAALWSYKISKTKNGVSIGWYNSNTADGSTIPIVILIQYGHGTKSGVYVRGNDFINPAIKPIIDRIDEYVWREVQK